MQMVSGCKDGHPGLIWPVNKILYGPWIYYLWPLRQVPPDTNHPCDKSHPSAYVVIPSRAMYLFVSRGEKVVFVYCQSIYVVCAFCFVKERIFVACKVYLFFDFCLRIFFLLLLLFWWVVNQISVLSMAWDAGQHIQLWECQHTHLSSCLLPFCWIQSKVVSCINRNRGTCAKYSVRRLWRWKS